MIITAKPRMLDSEALDDALDRVRYRDWFFEIETRVFEGQWIRITAPVQDRGANGEITLGIDSPLPPMHSEEQFFEWIAWRLSRIAVHEVREFLLVDGQRIYDPHAETP